MKRERVGEPMRDFNGLEVNFETARITYTANLDEDTQIDQMDLDTEFAEQPRKFAWWAMVCELAKDRVQVLKTQLERLYAQIDYKVRMEAVTAKAKLTEKMVENTVITNADYVKSQKEYLTARKDHAMLSRGVEALAQRKEMLISLGANARASLTAGPRINQEASVAKAKHIAASRAAMAQESADKPQPTKRKPIRRRQPMGA